MKRILFIITLLAINQINKEVKASEFVKAIETSKKDLANNINQLKDTIISDLDKTRDEIIIKSNNDIKAFEKYESPNSFEAQVQNIKITITNTTLRKQLIKQVRDNIEAQMRKFAKEQLSDDSKRAQEMAQANKQAAQKIHDEVKKVNQKINELLNKIATDADKASSTAQDINEKIAFMSIHDTSVKTSKEIHDISVAAAKAIHDAAVINARALTENNIFVAKNLSSKFAESLKSLNDKYEEVIGKL